MIDLVRWRRCALLALAYLVTGELGSMLDLGGSSVPFIWPPTGLSLAAVLLYGPRLWPGIAAGTFLTVMLRVPLPLAAGWIALVDVLEVLGGAWCLVHLFHLRNSLDRVTDVLSLAIVTLGTSLLSASLSVTGLGVFDLVVMEEMPRLLHMWWWSHLSANLLIAPALLTWLTRSPYSGGLRAPSIGELIALAVSTVLVDAALFAGHSSGWFPAQPRPFYLFPLLMWAGLRFGPRGAATASFCVGAMATVATVNYRGPFSDIAELASFVSITAVATLTLSATATEKLRAVRRRAAIQLVSLDPIISIDTSGRVLEFNPAAEALFGRRASQVLGRDAAMLIPAHRHARYRSALRYGARTHLTGRRFNTSIVRADGTEREVEVSIASVNVGGEAILTGFLRDRTDERRAERERVHAHVLLEEKVRERTRELTRINEELERNELLLRQAEEMAQLGSFEQDLVTGRARWSDELYRIHGYDRATFQPTLDSFLATIYPEDRPHVDQAITSALARPGMYELDMRIVRPDGTIRFLATRGKVLVDEGGAPVRVVGCCQDVTERKAVEEERYRLVDIAESSADAILGLSIDTRITSWNAGAERMFGYTRDDVLGKPCTMLVATGEMDDLEDRISRAIHGAQVPHYELPHRRKDGSIFDAAVTLSVIRDRAGKVLGLSKVLRDITQQKTFEAQLKSSIEEKEVLLREIHHRVKNNLQVISSLLNLQVATETSEQSRRSLLESQNRIQSMALVHQLLYQSTDLGRIDVTFYLRALAVRLLATYNVGQERIELDVTGPSLLLAIDRVIPCGLVVNELLANAIEHAFPDHRHGHIWLSLERDQAGSTLTLTVRDDGVGIPVETIENSHTFGLQIARTLTRQLGGTISIARESGTVIRVTFPLADRQNEAASTR